MRKEANTWKESQVVEQMKTAMEMLKALGSLSKNFYQLVAPNAKELLGSVEKNCKELEIAHARVVVGDQTDREEIVGQLAAILSEEQGRLLQEFVRQDPDLTRDIFYRQLNAGLNELIEQGPLAVLIEGLDKLTNDDRSWMNDDLLPALLCKEEVVVVAGNEQYVWQTSSSVRLNMVEMRVGS